LDERVSFMPASDIPDLYADAVRAAVSAYTFTLLLGARVVSYDDPTEGQIRPLARVHMSPHHAKDVSIILAHLVKQYEEVAGTITLPPDEMARLESLGDAVGIVEEGGPKQ
jgi:hypothetical protein